MYRRSLILFIRFKFVFMTVNPLFQKKKKKKLKCLIYFGKTRVPSMCIESVGPF